MRVIAITIMTRHGMMISIGSGIPSSKSAKLKVLAKATYSVTIVVSIDTFSEIAHIPSNKRAMEKAKGCRKEMLKERAKVTSNGKPECVTIADKRVIFCTVARRKTRARANSSEAGKVKVIGKVKVLTRSIMATKLRLFRKLTLVEFG